MRRGCLCLLLLAVIGGACAKIPAERPDDFSLSLYWDTGSLPPQFRYEYVLTIGPENQAQLAFQLGYGG